uniref:UDP-glucuronosyltransferase n=1 Tax=Rhodnius prolixus TaxID=13249 RepID=T1IFF6_RHOPR
MSAFFFPLPAHLTGNHLPLAYAPHIRQGFSDRMTFLQRAKNVFLYYWEVIIGSTFYLYMQDANMREYFKYPGSENLPYLGDMLGNVSLTLMNRNTAIGYPVPLHKNVIPFAGINVHGADKLPADLQKVMVNAKDGVIYFSFGTVFNLEMLEPFMQDAILSALGKLKYKVLLKSENSSILQNYSSKNIVVRSWFPQSAVLAHPNCKLFITHGGIHGLMEAVYHAVPIIVIPMMTDQRYNARFTESVGIGVRLDRNTITEELVLEAVNRVLHNPTYREKIQERSAIFKDQPIPTMDHVIYWIEYVIRHRGAAHLRPAVLDLYWYQYLMLDVIAFYTLIVFLIIYIVKAVLCLICRTLRRIITKRNCKKDVNKSKKE